MFHNLQPQAGSRPGTLVIPKDALATQIRVVRYDQSGVETHWVSDSQTLYELLDTEKLVWIHVQGLRDVEILLQIANHFNIHPLALEDVVNVPQRPKQEIGSHYVLGITRAIRSEAKGHDFTEQVSLVLGQRFVLSFQETYQPRFEPVLDRVQRPDARLRRLGPDYLAYALLDIVVDSYFPLL